jgi:hypothetical protein
MAKLLANPHATPNHIRPAIAPTIAAGGVTSKTWNRMNEMSGPSLHQKLATQMTSHTAAISNLRGYGFSSITSFYLPTRFPARAANLPLLAAVGE